MPFQTTIGTQISEAVKWLQEGQIVGIPTETVYGLAGNGFDTQAVSRIFEAKNRPFFDPLILHVADLSSVYTCVREFPEEAKKLAEAFWPGPLTLVLPKSQQVPDLVTAGSDAVAVRIPQHPMALALLQELSYPLAAPSANPFTYVSPTTAQHVYDQLQGKIPYILDGGNATIGLESTIVSFADGPARVLRLGGISLEALWTVLPELQIDIQFAPKGTESPGQLDHHYAPRCALIPLDSLTEKPDEQAHLLLFSQKPGGPAGSHIHYLTPKGDLNEAAAALFSLLRSFDDRQLDRVYFEWAPNEGLGRAINDRLSRAQKK